jgi:hypothetical protein
MSGDVKFQILGTVRHFCDTTKGTLLPLSSLNAPSAGGSFDSTADLVYPFIHAHNANSRPFVWTSTDGSILQKLARLCQRISGTEHLLEVQFYWMSHTIPIKTYGRIS